MALTGLSRQGGIPPEAGKEDARKLILFGGKGGVGKTTCASCTGLYLAEDFKTIILSTDPAHSLSDSLGQRIGDEIKEVTLDISSKRQGQEYIKRLWALEVSAEKALSKFKEKYRDEINKILDTSTYLDQDDIDSIFALPIPGMDEVMGFKAIVDLIDEANFDKYIVDTAPTGHALRLLTLPNLLDDWIKVMAKMRWKYRYMVETFGGRYKPDEGDDFLLEMKKTVKRIEGVLRDSKACEFIAVTIPEEMAILETERLVKDLNNYGIKVRQLVVNNLLESHKCEFCKAKKEEQDKYIKRIREKFKTLKITTVPLQPKEVRGIDALNNFSRLLFS